jgi:hypothetical protein
VVSLNAFASEKAVSVLERFNYFNDGLIRSIEVSFRTNRDDSEAIVTVATRDTSADDDWVNVTFRIQGLREVNFSEGRTSYIVLSDGLIVGRFEGLVFLDFDPTQPRLRALRTSENRASTSRAKVRPGRSCHTPSESNAS